MLVPDEIKHKVYTDQTEYRADANRRISAEHTHGQPFQRYEAMLRAFADMVHGKIENPYTADYELELFRTVMKCCGM